MQDKGYYIKRLDPETEDEISQILKNGTEEIIRTLNLHFKDYPNDESEIIFSDILIKIAETVAKVAAHPAVHFWDGQSRRIAFLPGYTTRNNQRITYKSSFYGTSISSDIVFEINDENEVKQVNKISYQSILYHYIFDAHGDTDGFVHGGTHEFLIENAEELKTKQGYSIDLLQVFSGKKQVPEDEEFTFLNIEVNFQKCSSVDKLYNYLDGLLNQDCIEKKWPYSIVDDLRGIKNDPDIRRMRGYLVSLWYKTLHDTNNDDIDEWFLDCKNLAKNLGFSSLVERIDQLKNDFRNPEHYDYWYSLIFTPLPDFTALDQIKKETLGSAMFMTNFELKPQFFYSAQRWVNRMYRHLRDFENLEKREAIIREITKNIVKENPHYPCSVTGNRWLKKGAYQKHELPLKSYYGDFFSDQNSALHSKPYDEGIEMLGHLAVMGWADEIGARINPFRRSSKVEFDSIRGKKKFGLSLGNLDERSKLETRVRFSNRICGRMITLGCYLFLGFSQEKIHAYLLRKQNRKEPEVETPHLMLRQYFFIAGLGAADTDDGRNSNISNIWENLASYEKERLKLWWDQLDDFLIITITDADLCGKFLAHKAKRVIPYI